MPIFYNNSTPSPTTRNTINSTAVTYGIRDFLLNKNLLPVYPQLSTSLNGSPRIGQPVLDTMVGTGNVTVPIGLPLETEGILFKHLNVLPNTFQNTSSNADALTQIDFVLPTVNANFPNAQWPQGITSYPTGANDDVTHYGLIGKTNDGQFRKKNTIKNLYLDADKQIDMSAFIDLQPVDTSQQIKGYLDTYGGLNLGGSGAIQAANVIGSVLNGQGLGLAKGGVVTNFDIRSSLAGRILGATGLINDTKLGTIGGQQLALALANNAAFNVQQEIFGAANIQDNIISLVKNGTLAGFRPSYKITIPKTTGGRILDTAGKILGFTLPRSYLEDDGSLFQSESGVISNIDRANHMILHTGKGQIQALLTNVKANQIGISPLGIDNPSKSPFRTGYAPAYANNKGEVQITDGILYAFNQGGQIINLFGSDDGVIANISYNREEMVSAAGFKSPEETYTGPRGNSGYDGRKLSDVGFTWTTGNGEAVNQKWNYDELPGDKKSLLVKTQKLFNSKAMKNIVSQKGDMGKVSTQISTANGGGFSKGNAVMQEGMFDLTTGRYVGALTGKTAAQVYCRSWTTLDRYDNVSTLVRKRGLWDSPDVPYRFNTENSVLDDNGFVKIAPYTTDKPTDPKKFMFSIENLAWDGKGFANLPECERGPGDLVSNKKGRIMWFPPYNIKFSENSAVNWESNNFIGRGEPVYTYNNTERSGNLSFQIVVDHPSYVNSFRGQNGPDDHYVNSFWAGCIDPNSKWGEKLTVSEKSSIATRDLVIPQQKVVPEEFVPDDMVVYFPNDNAILPMSYESGLSGSSTTDTIDYNVNPAGIGYGLGNYPSSFTPGNTEKWPDRYNFGLNYKGPYTVPSRIGVQEFYGYYDPLYIPALIDHLSKKCPHCRVEVTGYASPQGSAPYNQKLADARAKAIMEDLRDVKLGPHIGGDTKKRFKANPGVPLTGTGCVPNHGADTDSVACKEDRKAVIHFVFDAELAAADIAQPDPVIKKIPQNVSTKITNRFYDECLYFEKLADYDPFVFDTFREKIKYFHPAFHSTTPEGLNSRLTFLLQCTRQGPTSEDQGANNLAFGRPPVCILRIGDFYNTKIIMDSVAIDYEPLVWDLNPEGIGVQPMIANVTISFKFIGGSTLMGPINKLQNALSFNYFANSQVYDPRADYFVKDSDPNVQKDSKGNTLSQYCLHNGNPNMSNPETVVTATDVVDNTPSVDQVKAADVVASTPASQVAAVPPTGGAFTLDNITAIDEYFHVGKSTQYVYSFLNFKVDGAGVVIKPTTDFQIDMYLVQAMQPKNGATYDNCAKACPNDMVASSDTNGEFIGSVLLTKDGVVETKEGKKITTQWFNHANVYVWVDENTRLSGRAKFNNLIAQQESLIACNVAIQNAKPASERNYTIDIGFRLRLEIKDLVGGGKKTITATKALVYAS